MSAKWPSSVATDADLYVAVNSLQTTLGTAVNSAVTTVVLASATGFPTAGGVTIDNEVIFYTGVSGSSLTGCTRGADGTTAASHSVGVPVGASIIAFHHNGLMAEIEAIESYLDTVLGKGTSVTATEFAYVHGVTSAIQTQLDAKSPLASPTFTGTVTAPAVAITNASNQLVLGSTRTVTITAPTPATTSRVMTIPDVVSDASFVLTAGTQTIGGAKTFSSDLTTTGKLALQDSSSVPIRFSGSTGAHDVLNFQFNGTTKAQLRDDGLFSVANGAAAAPGFSFTGNAGTGIYRGGVGNALAISVNGVDACYFTEAASPQLEVSGGSVSLPTYAFGSEPDCGMYVVGTNSIGLSTNGTRALVITSSQAVQIKGTSTNDNATAGDVGESIRSQIARASATSAGTSGQWFNITSMTLTAGDWLVTGIIGLLANGATVTADSVSTAISINSGNTTTDHVAGDNVVDVTTVVPNAAHDVYTAIPSYRISVSASTIVYLKALMTYSVATPKGFGRMSAVRIR